MDIYANDPTMLAGLKNLNFIGLKVITRNGTPKEIGFLEYTNGNYFDILLNLDPLDDFPDAPNTTSFKHVKISVEYTLIDPAIENGDPIDKLSDFFIPKKTSIIEIGGKLQPEFYLTFPKGWKLCWDNALETPFYFPEQRKLYEMGYGSYLIDNKEIVKQIDCGKPFVKGNEGRLTYNFLIDSKDFDYLTQTWDSLKDPKMWFTYYAEVTPAIAAISLIPLIFLIFSLFILHNGLLSFLGQDTLAFDCTFGVEFLIVLMGFAYFYYSLLRDEYEIPHRQLFIISYTISLVAILQILLLKGVF
ncbi:MAG: hypothetical protein WAU66_01205 [Methanoregula sp.]